MPPQGRGRRPLAVVSATSYKRWKLLVNLVKSNPAVVAVLDFTDFPQTHGFGALDKIYPKSRGNQDPPTEYLVSGAKVQQWRRFSNMEQLYEMDKIKKSRDKRAATEHRARGRADRSARRIGRFSVPACETAHIDRPSDGSSFVSPPRQSISADPSAPGGGEGGIGAIGFSAGRVAGPPASIETVNPTKDFDDNNSNYEESDDDPGGYVGSTEEDPEDDWVSQVRGDCIRENAELGGLAEHVEDLEEHRSSHGTPPLTEVTDPRIDMFCAMRRVRWPPDLANLMKMSDENIRRLDELGFDWHLPADGGSSRIGDVSRAGPVDRPKKMPNFAEWIKELKAHKDKHGHLRVSARENGPLHAFCCRVRNARRKPEGARTRLSDDHIALLDALEFDWESPPRNATASFMERVASLRAYNEKHGHSRVRRDEDEVLYHFCSRFRHARKCGKVSKEQVSLLDAVGFDWKPVQKSFEERLETLRSYKEKHGHVDVLQAEDPSLYGFCSNIRKARRAMGNTQHMKLTEERIASLDSIGFDWRLGRDRKRARAKPFEDRIADLKSFKKPRLPRNNGAKRKMKLSEERIASLDDIGFDRGQKCSDISSKEKRMKEREDNFLVGFVELKAYKEKHGHLNVSRSEDRSLAAFCWGLRYSRRKPCSKLLTLPESAVHQLTKLGFDWGCVDGGLSGSADLSRSGSVGTLKKSVACEIDGKISIDKKIEELVEGERERKEKQETKRIGFVSRFGQVHAAFSQDPDGPIPATKPMPSEGRTAPLDPVSLEYGQPSAARAHTPRETTKVASVTRPNNSLRPLPTEESSPRFHYEPGTILMPIGSDAAAAAAAGFPAAWSLRNDRFPGQSYFYRAFPTDLLNREGRIGVYLPAERRARIAKFHSKQRACVWRRRIRYDCRKRLADSRPRIKGQFIKASRAEG